jgi:hypothetical protein
MKYTLLDVMKCDDVEEELSNYGVYWRKED